MKAVQLSEYGDAKVLKVEDVIKPLVQNGRVLVEVIGGSINPFDYKLRSGIYKGMIPLTLPVTFGGDFSGKVIEVGEEVNDFVAGDNVFGSALVLTGGSGAYAEFATTKTENISKAPEKISLLDASSLPLVGSSAVQALEEHLRVQKGQRILIHGGAGGIGSIAIQLAKYLGAYVATTVSTKDVDFVKLLGADEVVDYKTQKFEEILKDFDGVYDTVGGNTTTLSFKILKKGGILLSMLGKPDENLAKEYGVEVIGQNTKINNTHLSRVAELVDIGVIKPQIDKVFPLEKIQEAFLYQEISHPKGKVIIKIN